MLDARPAGSLLLLLIAALGCPVIVGAQPVADTSKYDGRYAGQITCDVLPGQTVQQLKTEFSMTIANGRAEYEREVLRPTSTGRLGVTERGTGTVTPTGDVSLAGSAGGQTWRYEASYAGRLNGRTLRLTGTQLWHLPDKPDHPRPCTVTVSRAPS